MTTAEKKLGMSTAQLREQFPDTWQIKLNIAIRETQAQHKTENPEMYVDHDLNDDEENEDIAWDDGYDPNWDKAEFARKDYETLEDDYSEDSDADSVCDDGE